MKFSISKEVFEHFAELSVGVVIAENIDNSGSSEELEKLISEVVGIIKTGSAPTEFVNNPLISPWKSAYFDYDKKPHATHSSVERLTKEVFDSGDIERKNKLRDLCSFVSLKHTVPVVSFDAGKLVGDFSLERAKGDEFFYDPNLKEPLHPEKGEIIYLNSTNVLARKLDYTESDKALVDEKTKKSVILIEGLKPLLRTQIEEISKELVELVKTFCKGDVHFLVLDKENSSVEF